MALLLAATLTSSLLIGAPATNRFINRATGSCMGLHDLSAKGMDGTEVDLKSLAGKKVIALNVASR